MVTRDIYFVLGADNVSTDISVATFETPESAREYLKKTYKNVLDDCDDGDVEDKSITEFGASILCHNGDFFYWNITSKRIKITD